MTWFKCSSITVAVVVGIGFRGRTGRKASI